MTDLSTLTDKQRTIYAMRHDLKSNREIAEALGMSRGQVDLQVSQIRARGLDMPKWEAVAERHRLASAKRKADGEASLSEEWGERRVKRSCARGDHLFAVALIREGRVRRG